MTARPRHGLVIGKFNPPHVGHHVLIRAAAAASERVTVLVLARSDDPIPLGARVAWLGEVHAGGHNVAVAGVIDDHPDDFADAALWDLHTDVIAAGIRSITTEPVTAVFSSEHYGHELARRLHAVNVVIDAERTLEPISATEVRADLVANWEHLAEPTRGGLSTPVVVIGAESTGKTTLSRALADALRARAGAHGLTRWVPEHGRPFTIDKLAVARARAGVSGRPLPTMNDLMWTGDEFEAIAETQNGLEDAASRIGGPVLMCDTDSFATAIWHERYLGRRSPAVDATARGSAAG
jgi:HTH-type transcriptional repressor of NAD biosynthesis genes